MNCEQVEEQLSAYLDNVLAPVERREIATHLQTCPRCIALLAELRQNDIRLSQLPRVKPDSALDERIFSSSEMLELAGTIYRQPALDRRLLMADEQTQPLGPYRQSRPNILSHPRLIALPGGGL